MVRWRQAGCYSDSSCATNLFHGFAEAREQGRPRGHLLPAGRCEGVGSAGRRFFVRVPVGLDVAARLECAQGPVQVGAIEVRSGESVSAQAPVEFITMCAPEPGKQEKDGWLDEAIDLSRRAGGIAARLEGCEVLICGGMGGGVAQAGYCNCRHSCADSKSSCHAAKDETLAWDANFRDRTALRIDIEVAGRGDRAFSQRQGVPKGDCGSFGFAQDDSGWG